MSAIPYNRTHIEVSQRRRSKSARVTGREAALWSAIFLLVTTFVFGASSLSGHVMVESARRQGIQANQRLRVAVASQNALARKIETLSDEVVLTSWAMQNGFEAPVVAPKPSGRRDVIVASR